jgi:hypothetical protein
MMLTLWMLMAISGSGMAPAGMMPDKLWDQLDHKAQQDLKVQPELPAQLEQLAPLVPLAYKAMWEQLVLQDHKAQQEPQASLVQLVSQAIQVPQALLVLLVLQASLELQV